MNIKGKKGCVVNKIIFLIKTLKTLRKSLNCIVFILIIIFITVIFLNEYKFMIYDQNQIYSNYQSC